MRLDEIVLKTLEQEPNLRYQHANDVKTDVESISTSTLPTPIPPVSPAVDHSNIDGHPDATGEIRPVPAWMWWANAAMFFGA